MTLPSRQFQTLFVLVASRRLRQLRRKVPLAVVTALVQRLAEPNPRDSKVTQQLDRYKGLLPRWQGWGAVTTMCNTLAREVLQGGEL